MIRINKNNPSMKKNKNVSKLQISYNSELITNNFNSNS